MLSGLTACYRLFCLYRDEGMEAEAAEQARRMLDMPVKVVNTSVLRYRHQARLFLANGKDIVFGNQVKKEVRMNGK